MQARPYFLFSLLIVALTPSLSFAYVGPGAGLTMLGSLWGLILAVVFIIFGLLILPIKIMRNKMKKKQEAEEQADDGKQQKEQSEDK